MDETDMIQNFADDSCANLEIVEKLSHIIEDPQRILALNLEHKKIF